MNKHCSNCHGYGSTQPWIDDAGAVQWRYQCGVCEGRVTRVLSQIPKLGTSQPKSGDTQIGNQNTQKRLWCEACGFGDHTTGQHVMAKINKK